MLKFIRYIVGKILIFLSDITSPRPLPISDAQKNIINTKVKGLELYQFYACPFCIKVRRFMVRNNIVIPLRDAKDDKHQEALLSGGGRVMVPCLRIAKGDGVDWLYESDDIIAYFFKEVLADL